MFESGWVIRYIDKIFLLLFLNWTPTACDNVTNACSLTLAGFGETITVLSNATYGSRIHTLSAYRTVQEMTTTEEPLHLRDTDLYLQTDSSYFALQRSKNTTVNWEIIVITCLVAGNSAELQVSFSDDMYSYCHPENVSIKIEPTIPDMMSKTSTAVEIDPVKCQARNGYLRLHNIEFNNVDECVPFSCGIFRIFLHTLSLDVTHLAKETFNVVSGTVVQVLIEKVQTVDYNLEVYCIDESLISEKPFDVLSFLFNTSIQLPESKFSYMSPQNYIFRASDLQACKNASTYNNVGNTTNTNPAPQTLPFSSSTMRQHTLHHDVTSKFTSMTTNTLEIEQKTQHGLFITRPIRSETLETAAPGSWKTKQTVPSSNSGSQKNEMGTILYPFTAFSPTRSISLASLPPRTLNVVAEKRLTEVISTSTMQPSRKTASDSDEMTKTHTKTNPTVGHSKKALIHTAHTSAASVSGMSSMYPEQQSSFHSFFRDPMKAAAVATASSVALVSVTFVLVCRLCRNPPITPE